MREQCNNSSQLFFDFNSDNSCEWLFILILHAHIIMARENQNPHQAVAGPLTFVCVCAVSCCFWATA